MVKKLLFSLGVLITSIGFAQIPNGYYNTATGSGYTLKTQLRDIIANGHTNRGYDALYTAYQTSDTDIYYENDNTVLDMYSENINGADSYNYNHGSRKCGNYNSENDCYNREHIFPQGYFNKKDPMKSDIHHVVPSDGYVNGKRSSFPFGEVSSASWTSNNGSKLGSNTFPGHNGTVFEPIDEFKGDIARMLLYFAVRYENEVTSSGWDAHDASPNNPLDGTNDQVYETWYIKLLYKWHTNDPVSQREIDRNNAGYNFQGNRNPFIDHPEYVQDVWSAVLGGGTSDTEAPSVPTSLTYSNVTSNSFNIDWTAATDNVGVTAYDVYLDDVLHKTVNTNSASITGLNSETEYNVKIKAKDAAGNTSNFSTSINVTTAAGNSGGGPITELFFSEYVEGSSSNKAIEIANFTGAPVSLANYSVKLASNGSPFGNTLTFTNGETIADGDVFVIGNSSNAVCNDEVDVTSNVTYFGGNDALGLFKNNVLIDAIGTEGNTANFGENVTLIRKPNITGPNSNYDANEWDQHSQNYCDLGTHNVSTASTDDILLNQLRIYPNPATASKINVKIPNGLNIKQINLYSILGKQIKTISKVDTNNQVIENIPSGLYLLQIISEKGQLTKKVIVN